MRNSIQLPNSESEATHRRRSQAAKDGWETRRGKRLVEILNRKLAEHPDSPLNTLRDKSDKGI